VVVRQNLGHAEAKFARMARALGVETRGMSRAEAAAHAPEKIKALIHALGLPTRLSELGVSQTDIPAMAKLAEADLCMHTNPRSYSTGDIEAIYREVW
jgi:lactaldehyde reductase